MGSRGGALQNGDYEIIKGMAETIAFLSHAVDNKSTSIQRLLRMLFGDKTEKTSKVLKRSKPNKSDGKKKKRKGHGKNGANAYTGAKKEKITHETLKPKDPCPACSKGRVYDTIEPGLIVRVTGRRLYLLKCMNCKNYAVIFVEKFLRQGTRSCG